MGFVNQMAGAVFETGFVSPSFVSGVAVGVLIVSVMLLSYGYFKREIGDMTSVSGVAMVALAFVFGPSIESVFGEVRVVLLVVFVLATLVFARSSISFADEVESVDGETE